VVGDSVEGVERLEELLPGLREGRGRRGGQVRREGE
jgi:hypothetical protein